MTSKVLSLACSYAYCRRSPPLIRQQLQRQALLLLLQSSAAQPARRSLSSEVKKEPTTLEPAEPTDEEKQDGKKWGFGFLGVLMVANVFTVWQEWDAITGRSNGPAKDIDVLLSDEDKPGRASYSY